MYIQIKGYDGKYLINKFGVVKRKTSNGKLVEVKSYPDRNNHYKTVTLWRNGKRKIYMLHNLVSETMGIPVEDAKRSCYDGYSLIPGAKENVRDFLLQAISDREKSGKIEESKYLRECLEVLK